MSATTVLSGWMVSEMNCEICENEVPTKLYGPAQNAEVSEDNVFEIEGHVVCERCWQRILSGETVGKVKEEIAERKAEAIEDAQDEWEGEDDED